MYKILTPLLCGIAVLGFFLPFFTLFYRHKVYGKKNLPKGGGLIVANHASYFDPPLIGVSTYPRLLSYLGRDTLFVPVGGWFLKCVKCHPIKRGKGNIALFRLIPELVAQGELVVLFPEGTRTKDGALQEAEAGVSLLIQKCDYCPVIPTYVHGTYDVWGSHMRYPKLSGHTAVVFGKPLDFTYLKERERKSAQEEMVKEIMGAIRQLQEEFLRGITHTDD